MDFSTLTDDQLADAQKALLDETESRVAARPDGPGKNRLERPLHVAHVALDMFKKELVDQEIIQPYSGGDPKP